MKRRREGWDTKINAFITKEQATFDFQIHINTVDKKIKKFKVSRLSAGGKNLVNRLEFIKALQEPDPFTEVINSYQKEKKN